MQIYDTKTLLPLNANNLSDAEGENIQIPIAPIKSLKFHRRLACHRSSSRRKKNERVVFKSGHFNLEKSKIFRYHVFPDVVTAFIEARWRWTLVYCILTYMFIWLFFSAVWWIIMYDHGDFEDGHLPDHLNSTWTPCIRQIYGFTSIFLFSVEVHTTVGYGSRTITLECPTAWLTMCFESILGTITQSFIVGVVFAKLTRPKNRAHTLIFSKNAVINQRNGEMCLSFRIGNTRKSRIIDVSVNAYLIRCVRSGDVLTEQIKLHLSVDSTENISFMFPISVVHRINESSPFYTLSAHDICNSKLEVLVVIEGVIESTGQPVQAKSSYIAQEILWGRRFVPVVNYSQGKHGFVIDYLNFDDCQRVDTPLCSAEKLNTITSTYY
ncbi:G protein-activated inward rectifier potassium channel 2-like [Manduca sexta]|uniref:G protein-activated inward rectifier potassium channel 2-like n=1 Tax=Manduca sexta TaxID=7130 RepID=UPI00188FA58A|nr:G protein-activated inward rectifier potassium channel 2-like [Manduca sexta]